MNKIKLFSLVLIVAIMTSFSNVYLKTSLKLNVRNELGNLEEGVAVQLFTSEEDYRNETNPASEIQYTDEKGNVRFKELKPIIYFVNAEKGDKNNVGAGVQTDKLVEGKLNKVTIIIE